MNASTYDGGVFNEGAISMNMDQITVRVRDLGLAAALVSCGFEILETSWNMEGRAYFIFKQTDRLDRAINGYWADTLDVKARKFFDNTKMLKGLIYSDR